MSELWAFVEFGRGQAVDSRNLIAARSAALEERQWILPDCGPTSCGLAASSDPRDGACTMDAVSWFAYGRLGDHPECASPVLTRYVILGQDAMPHDVRQRLKPFIFRLIGSRDPAAENARMRILVLAAARRFAPLTLEARGCPAAAATLRNLTDDVLFKRIKSAVRVAEAVSALSLSEAAAAAEAAEAEEDAVAQWALQEAVSATASAAGWAARAAAVAAEGAVTEHEVWDEYIVALDAALNAGKQGDFDLDLVPMRIKEFEAARS